MLPCLCWTGTTESLQLPALTLQGMLTDALQDYSMSKACILAAALVEGSLINACCPHSSCRLLLLLLPVLRLILRGLLDRLV